MDEIRKGELVITSGEIIDYMEAFASARGWNLEELPQIQFNAVCQAVGAHFFNNDTKALYINGNQRAGLDYRKLDYIYTLYVSICNLYNKIPSIVSLSYFLCIDSQYLYNSIYEQRGGEEASRALREIVKKMSKSRESSLLDRAIDKGGAVGVAIVGNYQYKWNDPGSAQIGPNTSAPVSLPCFDVNGQNGAI